MLGKCVRAGSLGVPSDAEVRCYGGYLSSLNYERRIPNWVLECVESAKGGRAPLSHEDEAEGGGGGGGGDVTRAKSSFYADATVPDAFRVGPTAYSGAAGLSRGHLASAQFHKANQWEMDGTFNMNANVVPQDMTCNAVDWLRVESLVRKLRKEVASENGVLRVVTGPAFVPRHVRLERSGADGKLSEVALPGAPASPSPAYKRVVTYEVVGKSGVAVPTHLFKVMLAETTKSRGGAPRYEVAAFLLPNEAIPVERPLTAYQVDPQELERLTGLLFFPKIPGGVGSLPDLCRSHKCETRSPALFEKYRLVARLRSAQTVPELRSVYASLEAERKPLDATVKHEFQRRTEELLAQSVGPVE